MTVWSKNRNDYRKRGLSGSRGGLAGCPPLLARRPGSCSLRRGDGAFMEWTRIRRVGPGNFTRATLGAIGFRLGRRTLSQVATAAQPDTILAWYRRLVARKFDGSQARRGPGRPRIDQDVEGLIVRMARENRSWAMTGLSGRYQTVGNVLRRHDIPPATERRRTTTWAEFIRTTSPSSRQPTSSRSRFSRFEDWSPTTCCSSCTSRAAAWTSPASPPKRTSHGCSRSHAM
jgi:hypothetical protein